MHQSAAARLVYRWSGTNQLDRIYGGYVNTGALNAAGVPQGPAANLIGQRYGDVFSDLTNFSSYALNANAPGSQYTGQYRNRSLLRPVGLQLLRQSDPMVPTPHHQFEKCGTAYNIDLSQTFWN